MIQINKIEVKHLGIGIVRFYYFLRQKDVADLSKFIYMYALKYVDICKSR